MQAQLAKVALQIGMTMVWKLLTAEAVQEFILWTAEKWAKKTEMKEDDEFVALLKKHLEKK